jgi:hypothetical protein
MPNTLAHIGLQGLATRSLLKEADLKWIYVGCIIPDVSWIIQRLVRYVIPNINLYDLRLYSIVQASFFFCLLLCFALAVFSKRFIRTFIILSINALFHLVLDAAQIKWANGVHFFAPFNWQMTNFNLFWPESISTYLLTFLGLMYFAIKWRRSISQNDFRIPQSVLRVWIFIFFIAAYFILPLSFLNLPERANNHFVKTLRDEKSRQGKHIEFDRARYKPNTKEGVLIIFTGEEIGIEGIRLKYPAAISIRGIFNSNQSVRASEYHIHTEWFRDVASYTGLTLVAMAWIVAFFMRGKADKRLNKRC